MIKKINVKEYDNIKNLIDSFLDEYERVKLENRSERVVIYAKSDLIYDVFKILLKEKDFDIGALDFDRDYYDEEYDSVYALNMTSDGLIVIERAYNNKNDLYAIFNDTVFISEDDCENNLVVKAVEGNAKIILFNFREKSKTEKETDISDDKKSFYFLNKDLKPLKEGEEVHGWLSKGRTSNYIFYESKKLDVDDIDFFLKNLLF